MTVQPHIKTSLAPGSRIVTEYLEKAGLLKSAWVTPESGRKRRVYELTKRGIDGLAERRKAWTRFAKAIERSLSGKTPWPA